jgi:hypothetical protein
MLWWFGRRKEVVSEAGARMRAAHSAWLTRATQTPEKYPRIPLRLVSDGGFDELMARPRGRMAAERWWDRTFQRVERIDGGPDE